MVFKLSQRELHAFEDWVSKLLPLKGGASYSFTFTPGSIGNTVIATRVQDKLSQNITDYESW
jgi:hypothetical protein